MTLPICNAGFAYPIFKMRLPIKLFIQDHSQIFYLIRHPQFSTKESRIIKIPNLSVIGSRRTGPLFSCLRWQTDLFLYTSSWCSLGHLASDHVAYLRTCLCAAKPHHQHSLAPHNVHHGAYEVDGPPPCCATEGTVLLHMGIFYLRAPWYCFPWSQLERFDSEACHESSMELHTVRSNLSCFRKTGLAPLVSHSQPADCAFFSVLLLIHQAQYFVLRPQPSSMTI
jgi:hypothetical protein